MNELLEDWPKQALMLLAIFGLLAGFDYYLASRVDDAVAQFEARAAQGQCTPPSPCRLQRIESDVCNAFVGDRLFPTFYAWHLADSLAGQVRSRGECRRGRDNVLEYVAPSATPEPEPRP
ncbi:hypothetical protein FIV42_01185 [Persicimonas caeni]|uniref:Uncharacterized protein n=1 Tax=Persicimonas caeni TaxID=2292766 RepID=A0A4Y6PN02_PERCE|nr:hypothetical protein [Persicimonas caeni]QDG49397.1 hypothetical protein FIV42_01185 [Persicimonas caeni]QED30618.1 hypothetical protein FRD00_01180 [Persicimonas caeni]